MRRIITLIAAIVLASSAQAAATYDFTGSARNCAVVTAVTTNGNAHSVLLNQDDYTIVHTGFQGDGVTASVTTDAVWFNGSATTLTNCDCAYGDGAESTATAPAAYKFPLFAGSTITIPGDRVPAGPDGTRELFFQAAGHSAKLLIIRGRKP